MNRWILVANRVGAKILARSTKSKTPQIISEIPNPEGKKKNRDLCSDRPGRSMDRTGARHSLSSEKEPREQLLEDFVRKLSKALKRDADNRSYDELILIAEPHMLGLLKKELNETVLRKVTHTVAKDLFFSGEEEVKAQVAELY